MTPHSRASEYRAEDRDFSLAISLPRPLSRRDWITADFFLHGCLGVQFSLELLTDDDRRFALNFGVLPGLPARLRLPVSALDLSSWRLEREGALVRPLAEGDLIEPGEVSRMALKILAAGHAPIAWRMTLPRVSDTEPDLLTLPEDTAAVLNDFGQTTLHHWPGQTSDSAAIVTRLRSQAASGPHAPAHLSPWGGWIHRRFESTGWFRTHHDGARWWLVDPGGHPFWSAGMNCANPGEPAAMAGLEPAIHGSSTTDNFVAQNLARGLGETWREQWPHLAAGLMRRWGFNTVANWSSWEELRSEHLPYVRPLDGSGLPGHDPVFREFPDVFDPAFRQRAEEFAAPLRATATDPLMIGYFLMNEPSWGLATQTPAEGMLYAHETSHSRTALVDHLRARHGDGLAQAWAMPVTLDEVASGRWNPTRSLTPAAKSDLAEFSSQMALRLMQILSSACRDAAPNHLNLGFRFHTTPPAWLEPALTTCDVISLNSYSRLPRPAFGEVAARIGRPVMITEYHFGALDVGLPCAGLETVATQLDRGMAYSRFVGHAAAAPWCVGAHWFSLYDQPALGRFDGECYNIGFLDVCHREYPELARHAQAVHTDLYPIAAGDIPPPDSRPNYLPRLSF